VIAMPMLTFKPKPFLDLNAVREFLAEAQRSPGDLPVVVNLTDVASTNDAALGLLVLSLQSSEHGVTYCGLNHHQSRLVHYLGGGAPGEVRELPDST
jgi:hypothetical protein